MNTLLKHSSLSVLLGLLLFIARPALAADNSINLTQWSHVAPVELTAPPAKGLVELPLPPELPAVSRQDLADLRLVDGQAAVVPYVLRTDRDEPGPTITFRPQRLFNPVFLPRQQSQITVDFGPPNLTSVSAISNSRSRISIDTPGTNFRRRVSVEASQDASSWQVLRATDWLFRINADSNPYQKIQVTLPDNDFRYLRITVFNAPDDPEQVPITSVTAWHVNRTPPQTPEIPPRTTDIREDTKEHVTQIDVDLGFQNISLHDVSLVVDGGLFLRRVEILGRNVTSRTITEPVENSQPRTREVEEPWSRLGGGAVYSFPEGKEGQEASSSLDLPVSGQCRYLRVRVFNGDDAPLKITGLRVHRLQTFLAFRPTSPGPYRLFSGNPLAPRPLYDLETLAPRLREEGVTPASLGPVTANPQFALQPQVIPWTERHAWLLWTALAVAMAVLGSLILRQVRQAKPLT